MKGWGRGIGPGDDVAVAEWWRAKKGSGSRATPVELVAQVEDAPANRPTPHEPLRQLAAAVHLDWHVLSPTLLARLAACLAREEQGRYALYQSDEPLPVPLLLVLQRYREVLLASRRQAVEAARWLLDGPPPRTDDVERDYLLNRVAGQDLLSKQIAMRILDRHGDGSDLATYLRLAEDPAEPMLTRVGAAARAVRQQGADAVETYLARFLGAPVGHWSVGVPAEFYAYRLAAAGPVLIPALQARLHGGDYILRRRAAQTLAAIGEPAVPALMEVIRAGDDPTAVKHAERALRGIRPEKVREARQGHPAGERSLSRAEPPRGDPERGLSRPEE